MSPTHDPTWQEDADAVDREADEREAVELSAMLCAVPDCSNVAGPEGFCLEDHEAEAKEARGRVMAALAMQRQTEALDALRTMARKVVNVERRDRWRRNVKTAKHRKAAKATSQRKNR